MTELLLEDRVGQAIADGIRGRSHKTTRTGWINICCPICSDRRYRCGIINTAGTIAVSCFNCGAKAGFSPGRLLSRNMKDFLKEIGLDQRDIGVLMIWAERVRQEVIANPNQHVQILAIPDFPDVSLPAGARSLQGWIDRDCNDQNFVAVVDYLLSRGDVAATATTYYWTPKPSLARRLIIPCYQDDRLVGWAARAIDNGVQPRYHKEVPNSYLFNTQFLSQPYRKYVFVVEGFIDALVVDGVAPLGATLNARQIAWINQCGKQPIVVPDRDAAGTRLIEIAIDQGWPVAITRLGQHQWWDGDIKDAADAVLRYGKLYTVQSILASMEFNPRKIRMGAGLGPK